MSRRFALAFEEQEEFIEETQIDEGIDNSAEIFELRQTIQSDLESTSRTLDVVSAMEDLCEIINRIDQPRETDYALIRVAAKMAVAGTNVQPTSLIPATEDFTEIKASVGKIGEKIFSTMKALGSALINIFKTIKKWIAAVFYKLRFIGSKIKVLREQVKELKKTKSGVKLPVTVKGNLGYLYGDKTDQVTDVQTYGNEIAKLIEFTNSMKDISLSYAQGTYGFAFDIVISLRSKEAKEEAFKKVYSALIHVMKTLTSSGHFKKDSEKGNAIKGTQSSISECFLGLNYVKCQYPTDSAFDLENHNSLKNTLNNFKIEHLYNDIEFDSEMEIKDVDLNSLEALLKTSATMIESANIYYRKIERLTDTRLEDADALARTAAQQAGDAIGGKFNEKDDNGKDKNNLGNTLGNLAGTLIYEGGKSVIGSVTGVDTLITVSTDVVTSLVWMVDSMYNTVIYPTVALAEKSIKAFNSYQPE